MNGELCCLFCYTTQVLVRRMAMLREVLADLENRHSLGMAMITTHMEHRMLSIERRLAASKKRKRTQEEEEAAALAALSEAAKALDE